VEPQHAAEVRRCLIELDIPAMRKLHEHIWPHYPAPQSDAEALYSMHIARVQMKRIPEAARQYSREWLAERSGPIAKAVGVACLSLSPDRYRLERAANRQAAMLEAVAAAVKAGIDIDLEAAEVRRRMALARAKA
jgi:hypothetical protein